MTEAMTDRPDIDEIEARANAATPGPWERQGNAIIGADRDKPFVMHAYTKASCGKSEGDFYSCDNATAELTIRFKPDDEAFLRDARTDILALVAEVRRLGAERDAERERVEKASETILNDTLAVLLTAACRLTAPGHKTIIDHVARLVTSLKADIAAAIRAAR